MTISDKTYNAGGKIIEWGKTFDEVSILLKDFEKFKPYGGRPNIRCKCSEIFGIVSHEFEVRAPAEDRPILQVQYELAPIQSKFWQRLHAPFLHQLSQVLGEPVEKRRNYYPYGVMKKYDSGNVVFSVTWLFGDLRVSLSVYGGTRYQESGAAAAGLYFDWTNEINAAKPYRKRNQFLESELNATLNEKIDFKIYSLQTSQQPFYVVHQELPDPDIALKNADLRSAQQALYKRTLFRTPEFVRSQLKENDIALCFVETLNNWYVSNRWDTTIPSTNESEKIGFYKILPVRFSGGYELEINDLLIVEHDLKATKIHNLKKDLEQFLQIEIEIGESYGD